MGDAPGALRRYVVAVRSWLKGEGPATHLPQRPTVRPVPLYVAAVTSRTVELASELADGIMPFLWSAERVKQSTAWIERGRAKSSGLGKVDITLGLPTFIGDDLKAMREAARATPRSHLRVAPTPDDPRGYGLFGRAGTAGYVQRLAVAPDVQRRGLGHALLTDGLRWLRSHGAKRVYVNTQEDNDRALALYLQAGFRQLPVGLHVSGRELNDRYFAGRPDGLRMSTGEDFLIATT